jgi:hypothetical protein
MHLACELGSCWQQEKANWRTGLFTVLQLLNTQVGCAQVCDEQPPLIYSDEH